MPQIMTPPALVPSPEVLAFAREQGVGAYLAPVLEMTQRLFPEARRMAVFVEADPEIADDRHIVIEVDVVGINAEQYVEALDQWDHSLINICPSTLVCVFRLGLITVES